MLLLQGNKVAVVPLFDPDNYGHIIIPDAAKERCDQGIVKYHGPDCERVKIGDHVIFSGYTGSTIEIEGESSLLIFLPEDACEAVLEEPNTDVPGLYFKALDGTYFTATYEQAMTLIARALNESPLQNRIRFNVRGERPALSTYDRKE